MITKPIVPLALMLLIVAGLVFVTVKTTKERNKLIIRLAIIACLFLINLRIMLPNGEVEVLHNNIDMIFVVDTTLSMEATDYSGGKTRLDGVKNDIAYIMRKVPGAHYSVIAFNGPTQSDPDSAVKIKIPLTGDTNAIKAAVNTLKTPETLYSQQSSITIFKNTLKTMLEASSKKEGHIRSVFIFTDGEQNSNKQKMESLTDLKDLIDNGAVLGYGTPQGGKMQVTNYYGKKEYVQDKSSYPYKDAISKLGEDNLKQMAKELDLDYIHMSKTNNIDSTLKDINKTSNLSDSDIEYAYKDTYYYFSIVLVVLFLLELYLDRRNVL